MRRGDAKREDAAYDRGRVDALREVAAGVAASGVAPQTTATISGFADRIEAQARVLHGEAWPEPKWRDPDRPEPVVVVDNSPGDYS